MFARGQALIKTHQQAILAAHVMKARCRFGCGARGRNRTGTPLLRKATDFKSVVSTCFTTRAHLYYQTILLRLLLRLPPNHLKIRVFQTPIQVGSNGTKKPPKGWLLRFWRREPESNRPTRICNPVHNRFAIAPAIFASL